MPGARASAGINNIDGLVQDCSNSSALAMESLQALHYTKPSILTYFVQNILINSVAPTRSVYVA